MLQHRLIRTFAFLGAISLLSVNSSPLGEESIKLARKYYASSSTIVLNVYNWEDYIAEDDSSTDEEESDLVKSFEEYCLSEYNQNVDVVYSTFDTNETMLAQLKLGKTFDLVCPSDYTIQKMIAEDMLTPFDDNSTPNYDENVSPFILNKIKNISVNGETDIVNKYARGYMWGTLALLYNDNYGLLSLKDITAKEMNQDMKSWLSLWDDKYKNLLAIKDSMRDTYAAGIFKTFNQDFTTEDNVSHHGLQTLKTMYENDELSEDEYNKEVSEIFNMCDDDTISKVEADLKDLRDNAFGFEVDSGKVDMAQGNKFAINLAWSGDASWAMDMADEYNESHIDEETGEYEDGFTPTILKYVIPDTGANIWFDGWVMPKTISDENKIWAERFVDFLSTPSNAAINMDYIGYTPVIAGDDILTLIKSWYDLRWNEESEEIDESILEDYEIKSVDEIPDYIFDESGNSITEELSIAYTKDISYFFMDDSHSTLTEYTKEDTTFYLTASNYLRQFDTQYPDASQLASLVVMEDFGNQNQKIISMWERVKNTSLPLYVYILIIIAVLAIIGLVIFKHVQKAVVHKMRKERKKEREAKIKANEKQKLKA